MVTMNNNGCTGQLLGPFKANEELYNKIIADAAYPVLYINHLGIQTDIRNFVYINGNKYEIGKTGIYEVGNTEITSIYFESDTDDNSIIDYSITCKEEEK